MKLQIKVTLMTLVILLVIGALSVSAILYFQRKSSVQQFEHMATALAGAVQGSLEQGMLTGERKPTQEAMVRIGEEEMVSEVILLSPDGKIAASSNTSEIGKVSDREEINQTLRSGEVSVWTKRQNNYGQLWVIIPILNKTECQTCHNPVVDVLGAIQVSLDTTSLDNQIRQQTIFLGTFGGLTFLIIVIGFAFGLRKIILTPLSSLAKSAQELSQGDYTVRTQSNKNDEIGMLTRSFNEMAESVEQHSRELENSRQELARWNIDLEQKIEQRTKQLSALNTIITTVSQSLDLKQMLDAALTKILSVVDIDAGAIHFLNEKIDRLDVIAHKGLSPECVQKMTRVEVSDNILGQIVQSGQPIIVNDTVEVFDASCMNGEKGEFRSCIILLVKSENKVRGTLLLASYLPGKFEPELVRLLQSMSDAIGIAVANAVTAQNLKEANKLREQLLEKLISAQEEERRRIARELHDEASQSLAALVLHLEDITDSLPARYHTTKQRLDVLKEQAFQTLGGIRNLALELRPSALDDLGLPKAIEWYAKDYLGKRGLDAMVEVTGPRIKLPSYTETMLFRIIQEALTNVVKHAQASHVSVRLQLSDSKVSVKIEDNGKGFDIDGALSGAARRKSLGLHGMMERASLLGGTLNIRSEPGQGTCLSIEVPLIEGANPNEQD